MTLWGIDISGWQAGIDLDQVAAEGFSAVIAKASQGSEYRSPAYAAQKAGALRNGLRFMAYHYVEDGPPAADQVDNFEGAEPDRRVSVMLDHEEGSGDAEVLRAVHAEFVRRGYRVAVTYLPRWYWSGHIGSPDLSGLPSLMASAYGDDEPGYASDLYPGDNALGWMPYGGNTVALLQFTKRARVAGLEIDAWAFRGTAAQLDALFGADGGKTMANEAQDVQAQLRGPSLNGWDQLGGKTMVDAIADVRDQLGGPDHQWGGWPQLGGRTVVDALAVIGERLGIDGFVTPKHATVIAAPAAAGGEAHAPGGAQ
ncbi:glycoside hydrolase family 25 protein [Nocardia concava]|uniref:glycoside hydrolase family 25 protein n=1 Tax=Nocardia concava TaxID=257281 RepID=UPI0002F69697|nr:GH25 family lysozyme [Nocardia concava]